MKYPSAIIKSDRLVLKKRSIDHTSELFKVIDLSRDHLSEWLPWVQLTTREQDTYNYLESVVLAWDQHKIFDFTIYLGDSKQVIGSIGVHNIKYDQKMCEFGYWLAADQVGKGYITESLNALESEMNRIGFDTFVIKCDSRNARSCSVALTLGYKLLDEVLEQTADSTRMTKVFVKS